MKKVLILIFNILFAVSILSGCNTRINYYENKLYSEKDINSNVEKGSLQDVNMLTREKAREKALDIFDKGFNIKLNTKDLSEDIRILKRLEKNTIYWGMTWKSISTNEVYSCEIDASSGQIKSLSLYNPMENLEGKYMLTEEEINNIINPLLKVLEIDINNYYIEYNNSNYYISQYKTIDLRNKIDKRQSIGITINSKNKTINNFFIYTQEYQKYGS